MNHNLINLLKNEVKPAMGCTEPVAVTLCAAQARDIGKHNRIDFLQLEVSANIFKNGLSVGIPKTNEVGIVMAGAIGALEGDADLGLKIYESISEEVTVAAKQLIQEQRVEMKISETEEKVYIKAKIMSDMGITTVVIQGMHNHFSYIEHNGVVLLDKPLISNTSDFDIRNLTIEEVIQEVESAKHKDIAFLLEGLAMNQIIANSGLDNKLGLGVGYNTKKSVDKGLLGDDLANRAMYYTAAASDARMSGISLPVMSSNGSGNNGLTAILPLLAYKETHEVSEEKLAKALAMSHLLNCYIKTEIGRLSALCSCGISAATGSASAITWLMGGTYEEIGGTIQNMIANVSGMICDGAKDSCALKLATAASIGVKSAIWSMYGTISQAHEGIVGRSVEESIKNLGTLSKEGMQLTDVTILNIMKKMQ